jgi:hypothetical protein
MTGWFEVRVDGPRRHHYRLFCRPDYEAEGQPKPLLVIICGLDEPFRRNCLTPITGTSEISVKGTCAGTRARWPDYFPNQAVACSVSGPRRIASRRLART